MRHYTGGTLGESEELGSHHVMTELQLRRILLVPVGAVLGEDFEGRDAFRRHRMRLHVGIGVLRGEQDLVRQPAEGVGHALGRLTGRGEELHAGAVGLLLLRALVG